MPDVRIVNGGQNQAPIVAADVRALPRANALVFVQVNVSGDIINPGGAGGGVGSNVNINQINGQTPDLGTGNTGVGTLRVVLASDQPTLSISGNLTATTSPPPVTGVQVVGGSVGGRVSISGDQLAVIQQGAWAVAVTGDVSTKPLAGQIWPVTEQNKTGVHVVSGQLGVSGDVSTIPKAGQTWPTAQQTPIGVQVLNPGGRVSISGDVLAVSQSGPFAVAITGDVLLRAGGPTLTVTQAGAVGAQIVGGSVGAQVTPSGDFMVRIGVIQAPIGVSGDVLIRGGNAVAVKVDGSAVTQPVSFPGGVTIGAATAPFSITGDVSTKPAGGQTWPVNQQGVTGVTIVGATVIQAVSGDVRQNGAWAIAITGDVLIRAGGPTLPVSFAGPVGVQVLNPGARVSISGDQLAVVQQGAWAVAVTGDILLRAGQPPLSVTHVGPIGVQIVGGSAASQVSPSGDFPVRISASTASLGVTGDVSTKPAAGQVWPVNQQGTLGVILTGAVNGMDRVGISGDAPVSQKGGWAVAITGDVLLRPNPGTIIGQLAGTLGVQILGGSVGGQFSASGDLKVIPSTTTFNKFPVSGDTRLMDGTNPAIAATVKSYTRSNPVAVVLVNSSGDAYNTQPDQPTIVSVAGRISAAGSAQIVAAVAGKRIKVASYSLQGDGNNARGYFANGASGSQLTLEWELAQREGVAKQIGTESAQCLFATTAGAALSFESSSSMPMKYEVTYQADDPA